MPAVGFNVRAARPWPAGWTGPWWLERQRDPSAPAYRPEVSGQGPRNLTAVNWTLLGALSSPARLALDPRGYLTVAGAAWGLDWWVGADDRWHLPSREAAVRQSLVGDVPVVQTTMRVPGGDVHQRVIAYAGPRGAEAAVEIVNDSPAPIAIALALRPITLLQVGEVRMVSLEGRLVAIDGVEAVVLPEPPRRALLVTGHDPDPFETLLAGAVPEASNGARTCVEGRAGAVLLVPLAHRATWRYRLALGAVDGAMRAPGRTAEVDGGAHERRTTSLNRGPTVGPAPTIAATAVTMAAPTTAPTVDVAARAWKAQVDRRVRLDLPPDRITGVLDAVRAHLLLASGVPAGEDPWAAEVAVAAATAGLALADPAGLLEVAAVGDLAPALWACGRVVGLGAPPPPVRELAGAAEAVARWVARSSAGGTDLTWAAAAFAAAAGMLSDGHEWRAAKTATAWAATARARLSGEDPGGDARLLASVLGVSRPAPGDAKQGPATAAPPDSPWTTDAPSTTAAPPDAPSTASERPGSVRPAQGLLLAAADLAAGDPRWEARVAAAIQQASPTAAWPDVFAPDLGSGCGQDGHSALVTARFWSVVRASLVDDQAEGVVDLLPGWHAGWQGQALEAHGLPTRWGEVSFALRWHGARPAILWSIVGATRDVMVRARRLDPTWSTSKSDGDALLLARGPGSETR